MTPTTLETKVHDFLGQKRIAVVGVSRNDGDHPTGNLIYRRLKKSGHDVFPVNPHMPRCTWHRTRGPSNVTDEHGRNR
jgi:predicted CoA-binding protein